MKLFINPYKTKEQTTNLRLLLASHLLQSSLAISCESPLRTHQLAGELHEISYFLWFLKECGLLRNINKLYGLIAFNSSQLNSCIRNYSTLSLLAVTFVICW